MFCSVKVRKDLKFRIWILIPMLIKLSSFTSVESGKALFGREKIVKFWVFGKIVFSSHFPTDLLATKWRAVIFALFNFLWKVS